MKLKTRVFELRNGKYENLVKLAQAMGISVSQLYRVRDGERPINGKFIIGVKRAFPGYTLDELFYVAPQEVVQHRISLQEAVKLRTGGPSYAEIGRRLGVTRERARQIVKGKRPEDIVRFLKEKEIE